MDSFEAINRTAREGKLNGCLKEGLKGWIPSGKLPVEYILNSTEEQQKYLQSSREYKTLITAIDSKKQSTTQWSKDALWAELIDYYYHKHLKAGLKLTSHATNNEEKGFNYVTAALIKGTERLLWLNLGGLNSKVYGGERGKKVAMAFEELVKEKKPNVIVTFGMPERCQNQRFTSNAIMKCVVNVPFIQAVMKYGKETKKALLVALKDRMENHFGLSAKRLLSGNVNLELGFELRHSENQTDRWMFHLREKDAILLEIGLVVKHLLNTTDCKWFYFDH